MEKTKLIFVGGFLGAGKTTLLAAATEQLKGCGAKVGLITNDQAEGLVDTHVLSMDGSDIQEIAGSCFCCDFDGLMEAALYLRDTVGCHTIIAEPVGSCTDLSATLLQPIKSYYAQFFQLMPLSVLVDPFRLKKILKKGKDTTEGPDYIFLKQLEEADFVLINKVDLLTPLEIEQLEKQLHHKFPGYSLHKLSALNKKGIKEWLGKLERVKNAGGRMAEVDYDIYASAEALMGWFNATFIVSHLDSYLVPWKDFSLKFMMLLQEVFQYEEIVMGHMKTFLKSGPSYIKGNLVETDGDISIEGTPFSGPMAKFTLNIRAETSPKNLGEIVEDVIDAYKEHRIDFEIDVLKKLSPGKPTPTHHFNEIIIGQ